MDFKNLFRKIFNDPQESLPSQTIIDAFNKQFDTPLNTEWNKTDQFYEAIFYKNELEHIAIYQTNGTYSCLKINLPLESIPATIYQAIKEHGEVMNAIKINYTDIQNFEFIVRDKNLIRYSLLLDAQGKILNKKIV
ncbi:hypothetical protein BZG02_12340 [Labilibaculum filiforme]|uniref:Uncharacterized protein n=1 Tax=Labilibaculum filiforme TaxID=1940526 RepID=A0A2N3HWT3_9BACT|nr:hypothetical protein [Labilibaculum filiforme]PKQ62507.1 hypothetical protein BZG02_12340 [Labilibaculum filiforme]